MAIYYSDSNLENYSLFHLTLTALKQAPEFFRGSKYGDQTGVWNDKTQSLDMHAVLEHHYGSNVAVNTLDGYYIMTFIGAVAYAVAYYDDKMLQGTVFPIYPFKTGYEKDASQRDALVPRRNMEGVYEIQEITFSSPHEKLLFTQHVRDVVNVLDAAKDKLLAGDGYSKRELPDGKLELTYDYGNQAMTKAQLCEKAVLANSLEHMLNFHAVETSVVSRDEGSTKIMTVDKAAFEAVLEIEQRMNQKERGGPGE